MSDVLMKRFALITDVINIRKLERENRKILYIGFVVAICFHMGLAAYFVEKKPTLEKVRYLPVDLFVRTPMKSEPYVISPKILYEKYNFRKEIVTRKPSSNIKTKSLSKLNLHDRPHSFSIDYHMEDEFDLALKSKDRFVPERIFYEEKISRKLKKDFSPWDELITLENIDQLGVYKGFVIRDIADKQNITGFVHIPIVQKSVLSKAIVGLVETVDAYTSVHAKIDYNISLESEDLIKYPFIYFSAGGIFRLSKKRARKFKFISSKRRLCSVRQF